MPNQTQPTAKQCPNCGATPTAGVVSGGLCPRCLLVAGLANRGTNSNSAGSNNRFEPPSPAEIATEFPELEIIELAGRGGMGAVYQAIQKDLRRTVALKILPPEIAANPDFAIRFEREAQALALLNHPNIVQVYHVGKTKRFYYFLMEYVDGVNLRQAICDGNLSPEEALSIVPQICNALQYAHNQGIVHRDIKPENILLDKDGKVKVTDFGLAKMVHWNQEASLTGTQQVMGTFHYMAPEQVQETRNVDHRADIYSLGVVFYEMLTGQLPLGRFSPPSQSSSVDPRLDRVVMRTLENEPNRRYQAASEITSEIDAFEQHQLEHHRDALQGVQTSLAKPMPPIKQLREDALRKVQIPAVMMQTIGAIGLLLTGAMLLIVLLFSVGSMANENSQPAIENTLVRISTTVSGQSLLIAGFGLAVQDVPDVAQPLPQTNLQPRWDFAIITILIPLVMVIHIPISLLMVLAGAKMKRLDSHGFVVFVAILCLLPINPILSLFSMIVGIWSLIVLNDQTVRRAFDERKKLASN